jgi:hypothetical protein
MSTTIATVAVAGAGIVELNFAPGLAELAPGDYELVVRPCATLSKEAIQVLAAEHGVWIAPFAPVGSSAEHNDRILAFGAAVSAAQPVAEGYEELARLAMGATPGKWMRLFGERTVYDRMEDGCRGNAIVRADVAFSQQDAANLDYVAAANPAAILALLADRAQLAERVAVLEAESAQWKLVAEVQNGKVMAMTDSPDGFAKLCEVLDRYGSEKRDVVLEQAARVCDAQQLEGECHERAAYCADAIRALKATPQPHADEAAKVEFIADEVDVPTRQGKLLALADRIDHEKLWRLAGMDHDDLTGEQKDRMNAGVALRRYADILAPGHWVLIRPTGAIQYGASTLDKAVEMARREEARRSARDSAPPSPAEDKT